MKKISVIYLIMLVLFSALIAACGTAEAPRYQPEIINLSEGMVVSIKPAKGTSIDAKDNPVQNNNGWAIISQGKGTNAVELLPTNNLPNIIILVKEGDGICPDWVIGKITYSKCTVIEKSVSGKAR